MCRIRCGDGEGVWVVGDAFKASGQSGGIIRFLFWCLAVDVLLLSSVVFCLPMNHRRVLPVRVCGEGHVRIIGGRWRNTRLRVPELPGLRPTSSRVRETLFNWLMPVLPGAHVLDLFAGSGALGLEAVSRGAARAVLVERHAELVVLLREQVARLGAQDQVELCRLMRCSGCNGLLRRVSILSFLIRRLLLGCGGSNGGGAIGAARGGRGVVVYGVSG